MSTTFGIHKNGKEVELVNGCLPEGTDEDDFLDVAFRTNRGTMIWSCDKAQFMKDEIPVYALDNDQPKDIKTIGDIRKLIKEK